MSNPVKNSSSSSPSLITGEELAAMGDIGRTELEEYFAVGAQLIWVVDLRRQRLHIYRFLTNLEILTTITKPISILH